MMERGILFYWIMIRREILLLNRDDLRVFVAREDDSMDSWIESKMIRDDYDV